MQREQRDVAGLLGPVSRVRGAPDGGGATLPHRLSGHVSYRRDPRDIAVECVGHRAADCVVP